MAKKSAIQKNNKRARMAKQFAAKRARLKALTRDEHLKLAQLPRNSAPNRHRLRCELTGRPRGNYRKFKISRISLRDLASDGMIPGMVKSSW